MPPVWCAPFHIVRTQDWTIAGNCGFKGPPDRGEVEIGYSMAPTFQNKGMATAAVRALLEIAFADKTVTQVLATINPVNAASNRVVNKLGFERGDTFADADGEELVRWRFSRNSFLGE